ncbi:MAG TPA: GH3 auxin-responsive promoter family protein, partial [Thermodesulfobacteriota bacterium]|nr:GH3 auxin-responsive promoter family protein [Thermodesulfobacteriota bacterium]
VTWPGRIDRFARTSGTTGGDKLIPVSAEAFASQRRAALDALAHYVHRTGDTGVLGAGRILFLSGSTALAPVAGDPRRAEGDLSGLVTAAAPRWLRRLVHPSPAVARIPDWDGRLSALARETVAADIRLLAGFPSWALVFFERLRALAGGRPVGEIWPRLSGFVHGGVHLDPFRAALLEAIGRPVALLEVYAASEGFLALQTDAAGGGLAPIADGGVFFEFVPLDALGPDGEPPAGRPPPRLTLAEVEAGPLYAVALSTDAGLWGYLLGDVVRFVSTRPPRLVVAGRTRHFVNAFGEHVIVEEVEAAMAAALAATGARVVDYTVAPRFPAGGAARGRHEWLVEFARPPADPAA